MSTLQTLARRLAAGALAAVLAVAAVTCGAEAPVVLPAPAVDNPKTGGATQTAVLAGGCFWGVQGVFEHVRGVQRVLAGYSGGSRASAQYETVSSGGTGHAESVQVTFDPQQVSYGELLQIYFSVAHDPTQLNRQGPDSGTQYRSAIFYTDASQEHIASSYIAQLDKAASFPRRLVTQVTALNGFYPAEDYHQDYLTLHPSQPYIAYNDIPKVENLKKLFADNYLEKPTLVSSAKATN
jgi:peptide-methionine (S)-S-oxide reductase